MVKKLKLICVQFRKFLSFFVLLNFLLIQYSYSDTRTKTGIVASAHPLATKAGMLILEKGGTSIDAAISVQLVLGLVEPQSSGLAGGGFLLYYSKKHNKLSSFDGREKAPEDIRTDVFKNYNRSRKGFYQAVTSTDSVGVPGIPALLEKVHNRYGRLPWKELFTYPIELAENGFQITPRFYALVKRDPFLKNHPEAMSYFYLNIEDKIAPKPVGKTLRNLEYASTLKELSEFGGKSFYSGKISSQIIADLRKVNKKALLKKDDFLNYKSIQRKPVCGNYRKFKICSMGPPSSGGITMLQILGILENFDPKLFKNNLHKVHLFIEATRLAMKDRSYFIADPDYVNVPIKKLIGKEYLKQRSSLINLNSKMKNVSAGNFEGVSKKSLNVSINSHSTTHFVILDQYGNALSMTSSVESAFGSRIMSSGMMLNNQLTDFSFRSKDKDGKRVANAVAPNKRPLSSMTPTIIFDSNGKLFALLGSPGGKSIISYVTQTVIGLIDLNQSIQDSINYPRFLASRNNVVLEKNTFIVNYAEELKKIGHSIKIKKQFSGLHGIKITKKGSGYQIQGAADPRREGTVGFTFNKNEK